MIKYVAFLRGINVGGNKLIKMADLRTVFERAGFKNVSTYIQSGNVIFEAKEADADALVRKIEKRILQAFGHEVKVMLRTVVALQEDIKSEPFKGGEQSEDLAWFVTFMSHAPVNPPKLPFVITKENANILAIRTRTAFLACRRKENGMISFPNAFFEK